MRAVIRSTSSEQLVEVAKALYEGGVDVLEVTFTVPRALEIIAGHAPDFALLDVGLVREKSFAIAERLEVLQVPFAFVTGYDADGAFPAAFTHKPRLVKPCSAEALEAVLKRR